MPRSSELCLPGNSGILSSAVPGELVLHNPLERPTAQQDLQRLFGASRGRHGCVNACFVMLVLRLVLRLQAELLFQGGPLTLPPSYPLLPLGALVGWKWSGKVVASPCLVFSQIATIGVTKLC